MHTRITTNTTLDEVFALPELIPYQRFMVYAPAHVAENELPIHGMRHNPLSALAQLGWSAEGIARGLNFFLDAIDDGRISLHFVYKSSDDAAERDVNLIRMAPKRTDSTKPFVILCSGGAYKNVCTIAEGIPVGRHFCEAGYQVFLLTYRVSVPELATPVLNDVANSLYWICAHAQELDLDPKRYVIGGFSAGGNLACMWGLPQVGWQAFDAPKPTSLLAVYSCVDLELESRRNERHGMLPRLFGESWRTRMGIYDVVSNLDANYPPSYIVCGRNDGVLSCQHSEELKDRLDTAGVSVALEEHDDAPHGFGDGSGTQAAGWPQRAINFIEGITRSETT